MTSAPLRFSRFDDLFDQGTRPQAEPCGLMAPDKTPAHKACKGRDLRSGTDACATRPSDAL